MRNFAAFRLHLAGKLGTSQLSTWSQLLLPEGIEAAVDEAKGGKMHDFFDVMHMGASRLFVTKSGILGKGPSTLQTGDICCILFGNCFPFILRPVRSWYKVIGEAYICDVMQGEAVVDLSLSDKYQEQVFDLI